MDAVRRLLLASLGSAWLASAAKSADGIEPAGDLSALARDICKSRDSADLNPFLSLWPSDEGAARRNLPRAEPGLYWLKGMSNRAPSFSAPFIAKLQATAAELEWRRSYSERQVTKQFWNNYCWTEIFGQHGPRASEHLACGALLLGAHVHYPSHRHEADEIYIPLVGRALWLENGAWQRKAPGAVIHHLPSQVHAMRTHAEPLLALYLWKSDNLDQKSELIG